MSKKQLGDIHFRDPYILVDQTRQKYYLYGSTGQNVWSGKALGFDVYESDDLAEWEGPIACFRPEPDFWSDHHYWAPEVYEWEGRYYMFASFKADGIPRVTGVLAADQPQGPFEPWSRALTPPDWECLDGTLFIDNDGDPWMVFCKEWVQVQDGEMYAVRITRDFKQAIGEPVLLFKASDAVWSVGGGDNQQNYVTDGPFLYRMANGELVMMWSTSGQEGYTMGIARSASGQITGPWIQDAEPLFAKDGGHGMLFRTFEGQLCLTIHAPNKHPQERPVIFRLEEADGQFILLDQME
ncbi:glycoside hydrolase family 43 protein [Paenibacillus sp. Leaf72]|uniref:glycoside hydrolase family 43 protein n=1 Tax=Paenibacillus sp. Leaf72 TaxID=1736234 RepID=UPI0007003249|nr:glycoside hydrolase family 43 protein [Paenibacillus sp. Leaf72]KQO12704.1 glycoside hydrolase [Paenibacillus sp. Leaf72]